MDDWFKGRSQVLALTLGISANERSAMPDGPDCEKVIAALALGRAPDALRKVIGESGSPIFQSHLVAGLEL